MPRPALARPARRAAPDTHHRQKGSSLAASRGARPHRLAVVSLLLSLIVGLFSPAAAAANSPPDPPVITSPQAHNVGADDVHMEIGAPYRDPDGDPHRSTDWEIRTPDGAAVVWAAYQSAELLHTHFSAGAFQGPLAGKRGLGYAATYLFRVRFEDSQGAWSDWSERRFVTADQVVTPARAVRGVLGRPAPRWRSDGETPIALPAGARLTLEAGGAPLLTLAGDAAGLVATPHPALAEPAALRLRLTAGAAPTRLPGSRLSVVTDAAEPLTIYLPALALEAGDVRVLWVTETGATFYGQPDQHHLDRAHLARDVPLPWQLPPGYRLEAVTPALQLPTSLAFVERPGADPAAPRFYVTELYGRIKVVTNDGRVFTFANDLLNINPPPEFPGFGEKGLIGVCLPPTGRDVYATMIFRDRHDSLLRNKVVRIASADGLDGEEVEEILVAKPDEGLASYSHQIQQCSFGPDGKLYVFVADGPDPAAAQDDRTFGGKVLRLNPDGSAPPDNPRYDPANPAAPLSYQYTKGQRNAFGMAWRLADGSMYLSENGPDVDRLVRVVAGRNYGWDGTNASMRTHALYNWPEAHWSPVGLTFVEGTAAAGLAPEKQGKLLVASAGQVYATGPQRVGKAIQEFTFDADGKITAPPTMFARYVGESKGSIADLKLRPDGLYFTDLYLDDGEGGPSAPGGKVWRIRYTGSANFLASAVAGVAPLSVSFADASTSLPTSGARTWDFGDGSGSTEANPSHTFAQPGRYAVTLTRAGLDGQPVERLMLITVAGPDGSVPTPAAQPMPTPATPPVITFPETGVALGGGFKHFWAANGGLTTFGYPITGELREVNPADGQTYTVQYFERARFEYHPEHKGTPYETQLGLLGRQIASRRMTTEPPFQALEGEALQSTADRLVFAETGHSLNGPFRERWERTGGAAIYGLPISEPFNETSQTDGDEYLVQYFERARMEHHPEAAGTVDEIRLARLGTALFVRRPPPRLPVGE
jgi:glucose/arabinose dehydrogenase